MTLEILPPRAALIVIDITKDSLLPPAESGIELLGAPQAVANSRRVIAAARAAGLPLVWIQELHRKAMVDFGRELDGAETVHCLEGTPGAQFLDDLKPRDNEFTFPNAATRRFSAPTLVLIGFLTDVCIHYTGADAHQHDYRIRVVRECVAGSGLEAHDASLNALEYLQRGAVVSVDAILDALHAPILQETLT